MAERRFGPTRGAGVVVIEKEGQKQIVPGALGTTAYTGALQKGPIGKAFSALNSTQFRFKAGSFIPESLVPDAAFDFFNLGSGAGNLWLNRITDGSEKKAARTFRNRRTPRATTVTFEAGNGGRWAGKERKLVDLYASVTATTVTLANVPANLKTDELAGGKVKFNAVPGKSFDIVSNTPLGVLQLPSDVNVVAELNGSPDQLISVELMNDGLAIGLLLKDGIDKPLDEWGLEVYLTEGGVSTRVKDYPNLSSDPASPNYFPKVINDDSDAEFLVKALDLHAGSITADIRPANVFGKSLTLTDTVLSARIHDEVASSVAGAKAKADPLTPGASVIPDDVTLTVTAAGARALGVLTFGANPADGDSVTVNGKVITFKTVVATPASQVLLGGTAEASLTNLKNFINASSDVLLKDKVFAEKVSASVMNLYAQTAGVTGNSIATTSAGGGNEPTWGGATLSGGVAQVWSYASATMPFLTGLTVTSGVAFAAPNDFAAGFTLIDTTRDSTKAFALGDTLLIFVTPLETQKLVGGTLIPNAADRRSRFKIVANTAQTVTVKPGSTMTSGAAAGDEFRIEYVAELGGGYDGLSTLADINFVNAYDGDTSPLKGLRGQNLGLVKLATPGVTSLAVQKAGAAFAESQNWQYRYEIPVNVTSEQAAEEFVNDQLGRNDFAVVTWPSFAKVLSPTGSGLKLSTMTGAIHGLEAKVANNFQGFHKAAAGIDVILSNAIALPDGFEGKTLNEEFLDPVGINIIKRKEGNFILWGDETVGVSGQKFKHKREYLSHIENVFLENFDFIIFAINDEQSQKILHSAFIAFFTPELAKRAIRGESLADAVVIKIDNENNTNLTRSLGELNAELKIRLADTVKRFIITISELGVTESAE